LNNIGYVNLFGLNPLTTTETTTTTTTTEDAPPSSDGCTQDTQEIVERFRKNERLSRKGKAKMIIHDDEEEDTHSEEKKKELEQAISEKKVYEKHSLDLEKQLKFLEEQFEVTRQENEDLQEELTRCNADVLLDLEELNEKLENDNKSLNEKLDRKRYKLYEFKSKNQKLEAELEKEGDSGRLRIKELENEIDSYERRLLQ
jgi:chromosome segregation ATPase